MEFPMDLIESIAGPIIKLVVNRYEQHRSTRQDRETSEGKRMDDCFLKTLYILRQESDRKKLEYIQHFAQNTILSETCDIDTGGILNFLTDIEQMTWRQLCLLEGFKRRDRQEIEITTIEVLDVNGMLRFREIKKLEHLGYISISVHNKTHNINIQEIGEVLAMLMNLELIPIAEIGRAFGPGVIKETKTY